MSAVKMYESPLFNRITGNTIRPGGFQITDRALEYCGFQKDGLLLDIGCGCGATAEHIKRQYGLRCLGIDSSEVLIAEGLNRNGELELFLGNAQTLPFENNSMDGVLAECSFSLMQDKAAVLNEIKRVLKNEGRLIISDMYYRDKRPEGFSDSQRVDTCIFNAFMRDALETLLMEHGFKILLFEDHTQALKECMATIILEYGSLDLFYEMITGSVTGCCTMGTELKVAKPGYFLLIAQTK